MILSYQRMHPEYQITIREYGESSITNFQLELLKGEGPDILLERNSYFDMKELVDKGAVEDLVPYLAKSEGISTEDILPGILELITKEGRIPRIPLSFAVYMMIIPEDMPQEVPAPQEMVSYMVQDGDVFADFLVFPKQLLLSILSGAEMDRYVDEENGSCSFDSGEFAGLLEELAALGELEMVMDTEERAELFRSGQLPVIVGELSCLDDYLRIRNHFSGTGRITGFPNSSGELRYPAQLYDWLGINSASKYKEDAWNFVEFCLSYTSRSDNIMDRFAVVEDKFDKQTHYENEMMHSLYYRVKDYARTMVRWQDVPAMTEEETDFLRGIGEHLYLYENRSLLQVINEEADAFFAGDISAQETAERIQNRAGLILGE